MDQERKGGKHGGGSVGRGGRGAQRGGRGGGSTSSPAGRQQRAGGEPQPRDHGGGRVDDPKKGGGGSRGAQRGPSTSGGVGRGGGGGDGRRGGGVGQHAASSPSSSSPTPRTVVASPTPALRSPIGRPNGGGSSSYSGVVMGQREPAWGVGRGRGGGSRVVQGAGSSSSATAGTVVSSPPPALRSPIGRPDGGGSSSYSSVVMGPREPAGGGSIVVQGAGPSSSATPAAGTVLASSRPPVPLRSPSKTGGSSQSIPRPDDGGASGTGTPVELRVNHFQLLLDEGMVIFRYSLDAKPEENPEGGGETSKSDFRAMKRELFQKDEFRGKAVAYDGHQVLFSPEELEEGEHSMTAHGRSFLVSLKLQEKMMTPGDRWQQGLDVTLLDNSRRRNTAIGRGLYTGEARDRWQQGLDVILLDNSRRSNKAIGRGFYTGAARDQLGNRGLHALRGFQHSIKSTELGLVLNVDHSVVPCPYILPVIDYLDRRLGGRLRNRATSELDDETRRRVELELGGFKVSVIHRVTDQKFTVFGLSPEAAGEITFWDEAAGDNLRLVEYYQRKYSRVIIYQHLPCLQLSKTTRPNYVPMELCKLVPDQRYPKERLFPDEETMLGKLAAAEPTERRKMISQAMIAPHGPARGELLDRFGVGVSSEMTAVQGHVVERPLLKLRARDGRNRQLRITSDECHWNLASSKVAAGVGIRSWGVAYFCDPHGLQGFPEGLFRACKGIGIAMNREAAFRGYHEAGDLSDRRRLREALAAAKNYRSPGKGPLRILICVMADKSEGYKTLKLLAETEVGILTQCCLREQVVRNLAPYLSNLALKINAKLGGTNFLLWDPLPFPEGGVLASRRVMFIGADVNHPTGSRDPASPSIAAVVASPDWPASARYFSAVRAQRRLEEKVVDVGAMCRGLVERYARANGGAKPARIVYFRDGVSDCQFGMVLDQELADIRAAVSSRGYSPAFTVVVAQKRHQTRFFLEDGGGNVGPGTVVDTVAVAPGLFNFYLCSHQVASKRTSTAAHYYVLHDDLGFSSDQVQRMTYHLCYTYARCTKPVSLVPPVYYADLLAMRGRHYYEAAAAAAAAPPPRDDAEAIARFPSVHADVADFMFFL